MPVINPDPISAAALRQALAGTVAVHCDNTSTLGAIAASSSMITSSPRIAVHTTNLGAFFLGRLVDEIARKARMPVLVVVDGDGDLFSSAKAHKMTDSEKQQYADYLKAAYPNFPHKLIEDDMRTLALISKVEAGAAQWSVNEAGQTSSAMLLLRFNNFSGTTLISSVAGIPEETVHFDERLTPALKTLIVLHEIAHLDQKNFKNPGQAPDSSGPHNLANEVDADLYAVSRSREIQPQNPNLRQLVEAYISARALGAITTNIEAVEVDTHGASIALAFHEQGLPCPFSVEDQVAAGVNVKVGLAKRYEG